MPYQEIQALGFPNSPRKLGLYEKPWACISWYGPCTQLVNSKYFLDFWCFSLKATDDICREPEVNGLSTSKWLLEAERVLHSFDRIDFLVQLSLSFIFSLNFPYI